MHVSITPITVRYAETDQMGVVYHTNYLVWFELGRTTLLEDLGFSYPEMERSGILSPVIDIQATYKKPVRYGERAYVRTWIDEYDGLRIVYGYQIYNDQDQLCVTGTSRHICVKRDGFRPISIRKYFPSWHDAYLAAKKEK